MSVAWEKIDLHNVAWREVVISFDNNRLGTLRYYRVVPNCSYGHVLIKPVFNRVIPFMTN